MLTEDEAKDYNAQCLDGSPPAIYYAPARGAANQDKWVLYFKGGGWCFNERDCAGRSRTVLGSSTLLPENLKDTWDKTSGENVNQQPGACVGHTRALVDHAYNSLPTSAFRTALPCL